VFCLNDKGGRVHIGGSRRYLHEQSDWSKNTRVRSKHKAEGRAVCIYRKPHAGIYGNEIADRLAKEATQHYYETYSRTPKKRYKQGYPERKHKNMAKSMGGNKERSDY
jgi:ribonuclease HI